MIYQDHGSGLDGVTDFRAPSGLLEWVLIAIIMTRLFFLEDDMDHVS